jgi:hypothetical protein
VVFLQPFLGAGREIAILVDQIVAQASVESLANACQGRGINAITHTGDESVITEVTEHFAVGTVLGTGDLHRQITGEIQVVVALDNSGPGMIWTGRYVFALKPNPSSPDYGWTAGKDGTGVPCDLLLSTKAFAKQQQNPSTDLPCSIQLCEGHGSLFRRAPHHVPPR